MPYREIRHTLQELHQELSSSDRLSPESTQLLREAIAEIESALNNKGSGSILAHPSVSPLQSWALDFSEEHPKISKWIQTTLDQATALGI